jgi:transposase-like protein
VIEHIQDEKPVSKIFDGLGIHPNQFYDWQKQALGNLAFAFEKNSDARQRSLEKGMDKANVALVQKNEVIVELLTEHIALKKVLGKTEKLSGLRRCLGAISSEI